MSIKAGELAGAIMEELQAYRQDTADGLKADVKKAARVCAEEIRNASPKQTGDYQNGWRAKRVFERANDIRMTVYNATDYQLTHLLEHGHAMAGGGGRVEGKPHIGPAEERAARTLDKSVKVRLSRK